MTCTREQLVVGGEFVNPRGEQREVIFVGKHLVLWKHPDTEDEYTNELHWVLENWTPHDPRADWRLDDLLVVRYEGENEYLRYFSGIEDEIIYCFEDGANSTTTKFSSIWTHARLATPEDIARLSPKPKSWWAKKREG